MSWLSRAQTFRKRGVRQTPPAVQYLFWGFVLLGFEIAGIVAHQRDAIRSLVVLLLASGIPFTLLIYRVWQTQHHERGSFYKILAFAAIYRALLVPLDPPYLSTDIYRYIWDGRVQAAGINPYAYVPSNDRLAPLRDETIYPRINRKEYAPTIYPPAAQIWFFLVSRVDETVVWFKAANAGLDLATVFVLAAILQSFGKPMERVVVYAWHPLPIWEFASAGHIDALMIFLFCLAILAWRKQQSALTGFFLGLSVLTKFVPLLFAPALFRKWQSKMVLALAGTILIAYLPYLLTTGSSVLGFLPQYTHEEGIQNGDKFYLLNLLNSGLSRLGLSLRIAQPAFVLSSLGFLTCFASWIALCVREQDRLRWASWLLLSFSAILSSNYPWYYAWLIPLLCVTSAAPILLLTLTAPLLYCTILNNSAEAYFSLHSQLFLPVFGLSLFCWLRRPEPES